MTGKKITIVLIGASTILVGLLYLSAMSVMEFKDGQERSTVKEYIQNQVETSNNWRWGDRLPSFVKDTTFDNRYYSELDSFGGLAEVAILGNINSKDLLLRLIIGCEDELDINFRAKIQRLRAWDFKGRLCNYYLPLNIRLVAQRQYQLEYSTKNLHNHLMEVEFDDCPQKEPLFYYNNIPIVRSPIRNISLDNKVIKGFIYYMGTRNSNELTTVFLEGDSIGMRASTDGKLLEAMVQLLHETITKNWQKLLSGKVEAVSIVDEIDHTMSNKLRERFVSHYIGPFFESLQYGVIEKALIEEVVKENRQYPLYKVKSINGYAALIVVETAR